MLGLSQRIKLKEVEQVRLNDVRAKNKEGTGKQGEWIRVKGGSRKKWRESLRYRCKK